MSKILVLLGSGKGLGAATAKKFGGAGYKVATVSRSQPGRPGSIGLDNVDWMHLVADLSDPSSVETVFNAVERKWGVPTVVIFNAYGREDDPKGPFVSGITTASFANCLNISIVSFFAAATVAQARNPQVVFLYTGNAFNTMNSLGWSILGVGKTAAAYLVQQAELAERIKVESTGTHGARFYYVDQRDVSGEPRWNGIGPEAHAAKFLELAEQEEQSEPLVVFRS